MVDDDLDDQQIANGYFEYYSLQDKVKYLQDGSQAIVYLESIEDAELPDLIILDLNMPILNGTKTLMQIKRDARLKNIPVVIYSTSENENERRKSRSFGALDYIVKPSSYAAGLKLFEGFVKYVRQNILTDR
jgi:CheY-like chemotaxis protein